MEEPASPPARVRIRRRLPMSIGRRVLLGSLAGSLLLLAAVPLARHLGWLNTPPKIAADPPGERFEVVLGEASFQGDGAARRIAGSVRNTSKVPYDGVEALFSVRDRNGALLKLVRVRIGKVAAGATVRFRTDPVPPGAYRLALREITGTPY